MAASFLWYDLETFGRHPQWDRIAQFAAVRTDGGLVETAEPVVCYCRLSPDYLPDPESCLVTGITPDIVNERGVTERDFAATIHGQMIQPGTCSVGYNNIRFDDEFVRALFYRNFYDPYRREYEKGNSRWDIIDLLRMCRDLRPEGINWPTDHMGKPTFALESIAHANSIDPGSSHDARADVRTTIAVARLLKSAQPKLFDYYLGLRSKDEVRRRLKLQAMDPLLHTSGMFSSPAGCTTLIMPLSIRPENGNAIISYDLRHDPGDWLDEPIDEVKRRVFSRTEELGERERIPFKEVHINRCPAIAPRDTLGADRAAELGLDIDACLLHAEKLRRRPDIIQKIRRVYADPPKRRSEDPELQIYSGDFFPDEDRVEFEQIRESRPEEIKANPPMLYDARGPVLLRRYIARNFPESLDEQEWERWKSHCASRLLTPEPKNALDFDSFRRAIKNRLVRVDTPARDKVILKKLDEYASKLEAEVLL